MPEMPPHPAAAASRRAPHHWPTLATVGVSLPSSGYEFVLGVEAVFVNPKEDLVIVKGTMDVKTMSDYLEDKLKRSVAVVPPKKDDGGGNGNKKEKGEKGGDKKKGGGDDGGAEKKGKEDGGEKKGGDGRAKEQPVSEANRMEYSMYGALGGYPSYNYHYDMVHAPQLFSDENPNACSIM